MPVGILHFSLYLKDFLRYALNLRLDEGCIRVTASVPLRFLSRDDVQLGNYSAGGTCWKLPFSEVFSLSIL